MTRIGKTTRTARREQGYVLIMMASMSVALLAAAGLAIDMGRIFVAKQETQTYVDAAALAATLELDGTTAGITRARNAVTASGNSWNLNTANVSTALVDFGLTADGPWLASPIPATGYIFTRVRLTVADKLYFMPLVARRFTQNVVSSGVAGLTALNTFGQGASPYTAVAQNPLGPNFGFTVGQEYTIQWPQFNGTAANCRENTPNGCFVKNPCQGDSDAVKWSVSQNWGSNNNGYWGFTNNDLIRQSVLDGLQTQPPISVNDNIMPRMTNGNKAVQATYLDERASEDSYNGSNNVASYLADPLHNGRRLMLVPVVSPTSPSVTTVLGWALMMLYSNGNSSNYYNHNANGPDPFCAVYVGPYTIGSNDAGGATTGSGAYNVALVR